jgi:hypothetical protein
MLLFKTLAQKLSRCSFNISHIVLTASDRSLMLGLDGYKEVNRNESGEA